MSSDNDILDEIRAAVVWAKTKGMNPVLCELGPDRWQRFADISPASPVFADHSMPIILTMESAHHYWGIEVQPMVEPGMRLSFGPASPSAQHL